MLFSLPFVCVCVFSRQKSDCAAELARCCCCGSGSVLSLWFSSSLFSSSAGAGAVFWVSVNSLRIFAFFLSLLPSRRLLAQLFISAVIPPEDFSYFLQLFQTRRLFWFSCDASERIFCLVIDLIYRSNLNW